jgi:hypothetical protein
MPGEIESLMASSKSEITTPGPTRGAAASMVAIREEEEEEAL